VCYSARVLYQELRASRGFRGSYDTVKRFVAPLRVFAAAAEVTQCRFETPPGQQSQIDWGEAKVEFRSGGCVIHFFVLTLGFSRRSFFWAKHNERLSPFLGGSFTAYNGSAVTRIARINANGSLDTGFATGAGFNNTVHAVLPTVLGNDKVMFGGEFTTYQGVASNRIIRLFTSGVKDTTWKVSSFAGRQSLRLSGWH
jgi:hypothetical protein